MLMIKAGLLIDGTGAPPLQNVAVAVEDGRIESIIPAATISEVEREVVDLGGATLLPGFVDSHVHLTFEPSADHEAVRATLAADDRETLALRAARNAQLALLAGVTTLRDCGGPGFVTLRVRDAINEGIILGPRILASGPPITTTAGHLHFLGLTADSRDEVLKAGRVLVEAGVDFIKVCASGGNMTPGSNAYAAQYSAETLTALVVDAHRLGLQVVAHAQSADAIRYAAQAGADSIEHCAWLGENGSVEYDETTMDAIVEKGLYVGFTFPGIFRALLPTSKERDPSQARRLEELQEKVAVYRRMLSAGALALVSSDAGVRLTRFEDFAQSLEVMLSGCGATPLEVITAATRRPAQAMGLGHKIGTLEAGKMADMVAVDGDPFDDIRALRRVRAVIRGGRVVVWQGRLVVGRQPA
jgi:imidazolonepropionase-like amidohydrolase